MPWYFRFRSDVNDAVIYGAMDVRGIFVWVIGFGDRFGVGFRLALVWIAV